MVGVPLSFLVGYFPAGWLNEAYGWRVTFMVLGLPGLGIALLAWFTLKEPRMSVSAGRRVATSMPRAASLVEVYTTLWKLRSFRHILFSYAVLFFFSNGIIQWQPTFFVRSHGLQTGELGNWFSLTYGVGGILGIYIGGRLASRYARHNESLQLKATSLIYAVLAAVSAAIYVTPNYRLAFAEISVFTLGMYGTTGPLWATIQSVVPERTRATAIATLYLFANLIGSGCGPLAIGALSDFFTPWAGSESLRYVLLAASPGFLWGAWHLWRSSASVLQDIDDVCRGSSQTARSEYAMAVLDS